MKQLSLIILALYLFQTHQLLSQDKPAYVIYTANGKKTTFDKLVDASENKDLVLFGEFHDNPISHWLQLELTKEMFAEVGSNLQLGFEIINSLWDYVRAKTDYWDTTMQRFGWETQVYFIVMRWSVNKIFCVKAPKGGFVLIVVENESTLNISLIC